MTWVTTTVGVLLIVVALLDLLATAVSVGHGAGPIAGRIAHGIWNVLLSIHRRRSSPRLLLVGGPLILVTIILVWVGMLILGWSLVFGAPETLLTVRDDTPVPVLGRLRYAASIVIGRGTSSVQPTGAIYEVLEPIAAMTGLTVLSLSIAYVLPVVQGVVAKRALALYMTTLGRTPAEVLRNAWNGEDLGQLDLHLIALAPRVAQVAQNHLAYPIVHFFHSDRRATALGPAIVALDEAMTAHTMIQGDVATDTTATQPLRNAIDDFLHTLRFAFIQPADLPLDEGDERLAATRRSLREAGLPVEAEASYAVTEDEITRNRLLRGYLTHDGWEGADEFDTVTPSDLDDLPEGELDEDDRVADD